MGHRSGVETPVAPSSLDNVDTAIIRALQADGRASWPQVAKAVGCSSSTARRRFEALHTAGLVRVVGVADVAKMRVGMPSMALLKGADAMSPDFLHAFGKREEVRFLSGAVGPAAAIAEIVVATSADLHPFIREATSGHDVEIEPFMVAHMYTTSQDWLLKPEDRLIHKDDDQTPRELLNGIETSVLQSLVHNARVGINEIAGKVGRSEATVRRIVESLESRGVISYSVLAEPETMGHGVEFYVWLQVAPASLRSVGEALAAHPATKYLAATTGRFQLVGQIVLPDPSDVFGYLADDIGGLVGVNAVDSMLQSNTRKRIWKRIVNGRYVDDAPLSTILKPRSDTPLR